MTGWICHDVTVVEGFFGLLTLGKRTIFDNLSVLPGVYMLAVSKGKEKYAGIKLSSCSQH